jgi:hypothetical protein
MYLFNFSQKYENIDKYAKKIFFNFGADSLNCGSILDNLVINPQVRTTVIYYTEFVTPIQIILKFPQNLVTFLQKST